MQYPRRVAEARIKGVAVQEFVRWYVRTHGLERAREMVMALPEGRRSLILQDAPNFGLIASEWYPVDVVHLVLDRLTAGLSPEERAKLARDAAESIIRSSLTGVYRAFVAFLVSPERYARNAQKLFR